MDKDESQKINQQKWYYHFPTPTTERVTFNGTREKLRFKNISKVSTRVCKYQWKYFTTSRYSCTRSNTDTVSFTQWAPFCTLPTLH